MGDEHAMLRSIAGDVAERSEEITGIDLRMIKDPTPLFILEDLKVAAKLMGKGFLLKDLEVLEKRIRAVQYVDWRGSFTQDLTGLGLGLGNIDESFDMGEFSDG